MSGQFFIRVDVLQLDNRKTWSFFVVYGPTDHRKSPEFLGELSWAVEACPFPLVLGGDFNMITGSDWIEDCVAPTRSLKFCTYASSGNPRGIIPQLDVGGSRRKVFVYLYMAQEWYESDSFLF
jgi:hypothetical protein